MNTPALLGDFYPNKQEYFCINIRIFNSKPMNLCFIAAPLNFGKKSDGVISVLQF